MNNGSSSTRWWVCSQVCRNRQGRVSQRCYIAQLVSASILIRRWTSFTCTDLKGCCCHVQAGPLSSWEDHHLCRNLFIWACLTVSGPPEDPKGKIVPISGKGQGLQCGTVGERYWWAPPHHVINCNQKNDQLERVPAGWTSTKWSMSKSGLRLWPWSFRRLDLLVCNLNLRRCLEYSDWDLRL